MTGRRPAWTLLVLLALPLGCSAGRIERGVFYSAKGYRVALPPNGGTPVPGGEGDLELRRADPPGGMAVSATCEGAPRRRPLPLLARYLTFGLDERQIVERGSGRAGAEKAERLVVRGQSGGIEVMVEVVVTRDARCVYDFLYVAPPAHFDAGRAAFHALVESFSPEVPAP
jgi:hypothetical protein